VDLAAIRVRPLQHWLRVELERRLVLADGDLVLRGRGDREFQRGRNVLLAGGRWFVRARNRADGEDERSDRQRDE